eukprot:7149809-Alexandrium_andersonii.AAC.1
MQAAGKPVARSEGHNHRQDRFKCCPRLTSGGDSVVVKQLDVRLKRVSRGGEALAQPGTESSEEALSLIHI